MLWCVGALNIVAQYFTLGFGWAFSRKISGFLSEETNEIESKAGLLNVTKHSQDQLLFFCGGGSKLSQQVVWVHVRVSFLTVQVQMWRWRPLPQWVVDSFLVWLKIGVVIRTGVTSSYSHYNMQLRVFRYGRRYVFEQEISFSCFSLCEVIVWIKGGLLYLLYCTLQVQVLDHFNFILDLECCCEFTTHSMTQSTLLNLWELFPVDKLCATQTNKDRWYSHH